MTFHSGWQQRKLRDSRLLRTPGKYHPGPSEGLSLFPENSKSWQIQSDVKEQRAAGGKLLRRKARRACKPRLSRRSIAKQNKVKVSLLCLFGCKILPHARPSASTGSVGLPAHQVSKQLSARGVFVLR